MGEVDIVKIRSGSLVNYSSNVRIGSQLVFRAWIHDGLLVSQ